MLTVDANVFISANSVTEAQYYDSALFFDRALHQKLSFYCPAVVIPEIAAGIARPTNNVMLVSRTINSFRLLPGMNVVDIDETCAFQAAAIATMHRLRGADAIYVAVAREFLTTLIIWDNELLTRGANAVTVMSPTDWLAAHPI